jgi:lipopolysaccharide biosynthesis glycosyltransferase
MLALPAKSRPPLRVVCAANGGYAVPLCVTLVSFAANQPRDRGLEMYVLSNGVAEADRRKIEASVRANRPDLEGDCVHWLSPDMSALNDLPGGDYISLDSYSRLLIPAMLPESVDRVLYLDCDVVVLADVSPIFDAAEDHAVVAARDVGTNVVSDAQGGVFNHAEMGLAPDTPYFNAGVMVINLRRWREENIAGRVLDYLRRHQGAVLMQDQGGLNAVLAGSWLEVEPSWNQMPSVLRREFWSKAGFTRAQWRRTLCRPKIVHLAGKFKPWHDLRNMLPLPRSTYFHEYLQKTEYRDTMKAPWVERLLGPWGYYLLWQEVRPLFRRITGRRAAVAAGD